LFAFPSLVSAAQLARAAEVLVLVVLVVVLRSQLHLR
jgi:hypothetical protein